MCHTAKEKKKMRPNIMRHTIFISLALLFLVFLSIPLFQDMIVSGKINYTYKPFTVQRGDTIWELAGKANGRVDHYLINKTLTYNNLCSDNIEPGQVIYIPVRL